MKKADYKHVRLDNINFIVSSFSSKKNLENNYPGLLDAFDIWFNDLWQSDGLYLLEDGIFSAEEFHLLGNLNRLFHSIWPKIKKEKVVRDDYWRKIENISKKFLSLESIKKDIEAMEKI